MKKNGFTLIEILVVIVLLAAISVTIGVNMSGMTERQDEKQEKEYKKTLERSACVYAEKYNILTETFVTVETLLNDGLLNKNLVNPKTKENVSNDKEKKILIKWENNEKICYVLDCSYTDLITYIPKTTRKLNDFEEY